MRALWISSATLVLALFSISCSDDDSTGPGRLPDRAEVVALSESTGPSAGSIQAAVDDFRSDLGAPNNGNLEGSQAAGRREINWDGADADSAPASLPRNFYNAVAPRGVLLDGGPRHQFQISADASNATGTPIEFGQINATYPTAFAPYSSPRLLACTSDNEFDLRFVVPGTDTPAAVSAFGVIFTDVDDPLQTTVAFYDRYERKLYERRVLATPGNGSLSFLGVSFDSAAVARVHIKCGSAALGPDDVTQNASNGDVVVVDDLLFAEPKELK